MTTIIHNGRAYRTETSVHLGEIEMTDNRGRSFRRHLYENSNGVRFILDVLEQDGRRSWNSVTPVTKSTDMCDLKDFPIHFNHTRVARTHCHHCGGML